MSNILRNRLRSSSESKRISSRNFIFDNIIQQRICEIEKLSQTRNKKALIKENNNVSNYNY